MSLGAAPPCPPHTQASSQLPLHVVGRSLTGLMGPGLPTLLCPVGARLWSVSPCTPPGMKGREGPPPHGCPLASILSLCPLLGAPDLSVRKRDWKMAPGENLGVKK